VTITSFGVKRVQIKKGPHAPKALALGVGFSGALDPTAAQNLTAYTVFSGTVKKVHKVSQVLYNKLVPLSRAIYFPTSDTLALLPRGLHKLPKLEQLQVNVSILTDPMGRPINNGKNFNATVTNAGLVISTRSSASAPEAPVAAAVDALFERGLAFSDSAHAVARESVLNPWAGGPRRLQISTASPIDAHAASDRPTAALHHVRPDRKPLQLDSHTGAAGHRHHGA
jgi:hypothetical protein